MDVQKIHSSCHLLFEPKNLDIHRTQLCQFKLQSNVAASRFLFRSGKLSVIEILVSHMASVQLLIQTCCWRPSVWMHCWNGSVSIFPLSLNRIDHWFVVGLLAAFTNQSTTNCWHWKPWINWAPHRTDASSPAILVLDGSSAGLLLLGTLSIHQNDGK